MDPTSPEQTYNGLTFLARTFEEIRLINARVNAVAELARMIESRKPSETMRRACKQILIAYSDAEQFKRGQKKRKRGGRPTKLPQARELLKHLLANGPQPANHVLQLARNLGISRTTIFRARAELGIASYRDGYAAQGEFSWRMRTSPSPNGKEAA